MTETTTDKPAAIPDHPSGPKHHDHPSDWEYVKVAIFLAVVTAGEVGLYYANGVSARLILLMLLVLMSVKFAVVVMWFMHLRFDSKVFRRFFIAGLALACGVYLIVLSTFHIWSR